MNKTRIAKFISIRVTTAGISRLAATAARWGRSYWYKDELRIALSTHERPELSDCLILVTDGPITSNEIEDLVVGEL